MSDFGLSDRQRVTVVAAITILSACVILAAVGGLIFLVSIFFRTFSGVFLPLAVAAFLALVVKPYYDWFARRLPALLAVCVVFLSFLLPLAAFFAFFGSILFRQLVDLVERLPEWSLSLRVWAEANTPQVMDLWERYGLEERLRAMLEENQEDLLSGLQFFSSKALSAGAGLLRGVGTFLGWIVLPIYFAFFLMGTPSPGKAERLLPFLKPETRDDVVYLIAEFVEIMVAFFRGQLVIAFLQGVLYAIGFSVVGLRYGLILGLLLGFLNIIPYLGSIVGLGVCLPLALFQVNGGWGTVVAVVIVFTIVQLIESYVLTPRIMGQKTGLHPMVIIVAIFFWGTALGGIAGMILAIPLTAFGVVFWRLAQQKYIGELV